MKNLTKHLLLLIIFLGTMLSFAFSAQKAAAQTPTQVPTPWLCYFSYYSDSNNCNSNRNPTLKTFFCTIAELANQQVARNIVETCRTSLTRILCSKCPSESTCKVAADDKSGTCITQGPCGVTFDWKDKFTSKTSNPPFSITYKSGPTELGKQIIDDGIKTTAFTFNNVSPGEYKVEVCGRPYNMRNPSPCIDSTSQAICPDGPAPTPTPTPTSKFVWKPLPACPAPASTSASTPISTSSTTAPAARVSINSQKVSYILKNGTTPSYIVFRRTGGTTDGYLHTCELQGTALDIGLHPNLVLETDPNACASWANPLVNGTVYTVIFDTTDPDGKKVSTITNDVTYDKSAPVSTLSLEVAPLTLTPKPGPSSTTAPTPTPACKDRHSSCASCNDDPWCSWAEISGFPEFCTEFPHTDKCPIGFTKFFPHRGNCITNVCVSIPTATSAPTPTPACQTDVDCSKAETCVVNSLNSLPYCLTRGTGSEGLYCGKPNKGGPNNSACSSGVCDPYLRCASTTTPGPVTQEKCVEFSYFDELLKTFKAGSEPDEKLLPYVNLDSNDKVEFSSFDKLLNAYKQNSCT